MMTLLLLIASAAQAQTASTLEQAAVRVSAVVRTSPNPQIKLVWPVADANPAAYTIWRKAKNATSWGTALATLPSGAATEYDDNTVAVGTAYEYRVRRTTTGGEGYVYAGMEVPVVESRGTVLLLVADTHAPYLAADLDQLQNDLVGDGWQVIRHDVPAAATPPQVKAQIQADYAAHPTEVKAVFILGHVAVPYSGLMYPDGHPDHWGAWPADMYYADMAGTWTDVTANDVYGSRIENHNTPGDGHFDQTTPPRGSPTTGYTLELQVGRVDLSNLPSFSLSERELLQRYLRKDHQFRHKVFSVAERGLVDDHFGLFNGEAFSNNGWRNQSALLGAGNVSAGPFFATLGTQDYLMAYACGGGYYNRMNGVGYTSSFASQAVKSVFNMYYGSYFGDWDNSDNLLRAAIAGDGYTLTSCWAGRPNWEFHHLGLGETVGFGTWVTQTQPQLYTENYGSGFTEVSLLGDPTLRLHPLAPPSGLLATKVAGLGTLSWADSPAPVLGYYVYRAASATGPFVRITPQPLTATLFTDPTPVTGNPMYMVRALELRTSASGTYYNLSQGILSPIVVVPGGSAWLGRTATWASPSNWSTGRVPGPTDAAVILTNARYAPVVSGTADVRTLTLMQGALLTVPAGGQLLVRDTLLLSTTLSGTTRLVLADSSGALAGGRLQVLDRATPAAGLLLASGTTVMIGNGATLTLLGDLGRGGGTASFAPLGQLIFAHDPSLSTGVSHALSSLGTTAAGVLRLADARDQLILTSPLTVQTKIENLGTIITNNNLTLASGPGRQAVLGPVAPAVGQALTLGTYTGNVRVQVYVDGTINSYYGYRHLSPPVGGTTVSNLSVGSFVPTVNPAFNTQGGLARPFPTVFRYDQALVTTTGFNQGWLSPNALTDAMPPGRGFIANMTALATLSMSGPALTTPSFSFGTLPADNATGAGWHLLGNPYAAPLDWDHLMASTTVAGTAPMALYVFKSSDQYGGAYAAYLPGTGGYPGIGLNGGTPVVPVGQAFFVRAAAPLGTPLTIRLADLIPTATTTVQRAAADTRPRLTIALQNQAGTLTHETAVYFQAGATGGPDAAYDALSLANDGQALLLTSVVGSTQYTINGLPALTGADVLLPLQLSAATAGSYRLAVQTLAALPPRYHAYLRDTQTGTLTNLAATPATAVTLPANTPVRRYAVLFSTQSQALATATQSLSLSLAIAPNPAHGTATLTLPLATRKGYKTSIEIRNALGQLMLTRILPAATETLELPLAGLVPGMYMVQAHTAAGPVSGRLVVE